MAGGANSLHKQLRNALENYIKTQYLGKSPILLKALGSKLDDEGVLYQKPYIESSPAYKIENNGIAYTQIPQWMKKYFSDLSNCNIGVYSSPFVHQIQALEAAVSGRDVFVATGTGSGKTECFMWPMIARIADEARNRKESWEKRGVRTIIMYPMNALVSDQLSRLRKLLGNDKFIETLRTTCGYMCRRPQFGMYTGRTPYPGEMPDKKQDRDLARTLETLVNSDNENKEFLEELEERGKIPSKANLSEFVNCNNNLRIH